ncbi:MAG: aldehyde dehydrogenase family protein, partial [Novosphingobium sp.]|nr:aldehyde dehydrogenase family protein [Novosphingobium sp.]
MVELKDSGLLKQAALVNGEWIAPGADAIDVVNPSTGDLIGRIPACGRSETEAAIVAATAAWPEWRARTAHERSVLVERWHALVMENLPDLARIMTAEQGKPLAEAEGEMRYAASFIKWFA